MAWTKRGDGRVDGAVARDSRDVRCFIREKEKRLIDRCTIGQPGERLPRSSLYQQGVEAGDLVSRTYSLTRSTRPESSPRATARVG